MKIHDVIMAAADTRGMSAAAISRAIGKSAGYYGATVARGSDPSTDKAAAMLAVCGWRLCALPADQVPAAALVIGDDAQDAERIKAARRADLQQRINALQDELNALE